ncbi:hypothetical protein ACIBL3_10035 [Kribbella sp. NPDC050124]|uniref:hypothetical protein n=1 Tax=Kribbella sp. NPDC050124 TaxID=3364114 RepID=UPI0037A2DA43
MSEILRPNSSGPRGNARAARSGCVWLATVTGILCLIYQWGVPGTIVCALLGAVTGAAVASAVWPEEDEGWHAVRGIGRCGLAAGMLVPGAIGLMAAFGFAGVLIVLFLVCTAPGVVSLVRERWFPAKDRPAQQDQPVPAPPSRPATHEPTVEPPPLAVMDDAALCLAWRRSFVRLQSARTATERLAVVEQRQQYLDELHRRSPGGLAAWFASGARASGNPLPYVDEDRRRID